MDSQSLVKSTAEWNKKDKLTLLNIQKGVSSLGTFFSIVQCTNLFLINHKENNSITIGFGVTTLVVTLLNLLTLFWALRQTKKAKEAQDNDAESTDNDFSRLLLFFSLVLFQVFGLYYVIYKFAEEDLENQYKAGHNEKEFQIFHDYLDQKRDWINFLSLANLLIGFFTVFCAYALASSALTHRLMVYLFGFILLFVSLHQLSQRVYLRHVYSSSEESEEESRPTGWPDHIIHAVALTTIIFLALTYLANAKRNRLAYMILGVFFLVVVAVSIPATGQLFRDYKKISHFYKDHCVSEISKIDSKFIEDRQCPAKYLYTTPESKNTCTDAADKTTCFKDISSCSTSDYAQVWEKSLVPKSTTNNVLACINTFCCGSLVNIYARPVLHQAALSLTFLIYAFLLGVFTFQLSSKDKGDKQLHRTQQAFLFFAFSVLLLIGVIYLSIPHTRGYLPLQQGVEEGLQLKNGYKSQFFSFLGEEKDDKKNAIRIKPQEGDEQYYGIGNTQSISDYFKFSKTNFAKFSVQAGAATTPIATFNEVTNLDQLSTSDDSCVLPTVCVNPGYILAIKVSTCQAQFSFNVHHSDEENNYFRVIAAQNVAPILGDAAPAASTHYFGLVGRQQQIVQILSSDSHKDGLYLANVPATPTAATACQLVFHVAKIDLNNYGFTSGSKAAETAPAEAKHAHSFAVPQLKKHAAKKYHLAAVPVKDLKSASFKIHVHTLEHDEPVHHAKVEVFLQYAATATYKDDLLCSKTQFATSQADFTGETDHHGHVEIEFLYSTTKFIVFVYAKHDDLTTNCRAFAITSVADFALQEGFDIGLGSRLEKGETRAVLEWDRGLKAAHDKLTTAADSTDPEKIDLDLYATFGDYGANDVEQFDCHVGVTDNSCGGLKYHGDSKHKKFGTSSEAITFHVIGNYHYLVFFSRFYEGSTKGATGTPYNWASNVLTLNPVIKYYAHQSEAPLKANAVTFTNADINKGTKLSVASLCVDGKFTQKADDATVGANVWSDAVASVWNDQSSNNFPTSESKQTTGGKGICTWRAAL